jgi:16S rRNA A1518/A1519 N6-dimethyltransferase RsmA/KsgA/DIM1 with predicted DNA glycosylase/AP lyase activity
MIWAELLLVVLIVSFGSALLFGAPYLPTLKLQITSALDLAGVKKGQTMLELGCGDGRVVAAAAKRGAKVVAYELNPVLAAIAWLRTRRYAKNVRIIWGDFWQQDWPEADSIFVFLLPRYMDKLNTKIMQLKSKNVKLVSFAFQIPGKEPDRLQDGVYLYLYK